MADMKRTIKCGNCDKEYKDLGEIIPLEQCKELDQRLDIDSVVPAGECKECGAFCYLDPHNDSEVTWMGKLLSEVIRRFARAGFAIPEDIHGWGVQDVIGFLLEVLAEATILPRGEVDKQLSAQLIRLNTNLDKVITGNDQVGYAIRIQKTEVE